MRVVANRVAKLALTIVDQDGDLVDPDGGPPPDTLPVQVLDGVGAVLTGAPATATRTGVGRYEYVLPPQPKLDRLIINMTSTVEGYERIDSGVVDVVGARLLRLDELKADRDLAKLSAEQLRRIVDSIETEFRDIVGFPVVPEAARVAFDHRGSWGVGGAYLGAPTVTGYPLDGLAGGGRLNIPGVALPIGVYSASVNFSPIGSGDLARIGYADGELQWADGRGWPAGRYTLWVAHGLVAPEEDLRRAGTYMARYLARRTPQIGKAGSNLPERTASITTEGATIVFARPSYDQPTGLPEVDNVLVRYRGENVI